LAKITLSCGRTDATHNPDGLWIGNKYTAVAHSESRFWITQYTTGIMELLDTLHQRIADCSALAK
jgi:hypothetical protein